MRVFEHRSTAITSGISDERGDGIPSLTIIRRGSHLHHTSGRTVVADPGSAVLYRALHPFRLSHPFRQAAPDVSLYLEFDPALLGELFGPKPLLRDLAQPLTPATLLAAAVLRNGLVRAPGDQLAGEERATELLGRVARDLATIRLDRAATAAGRRRIDRVREQIATAPCANHDLATLARDVGCSPFHLSRQFRRATGISLRRFRLQLRLAVVLDGLAEGHDDLTALALDAGFADHPHMSNSFRKAFGRTPSAAREEIGSVGLARASKNVQARALRLG